jgi:hypothetical protein
MYVKDLFIRNSDGSLDVASQQKATVISSRPWR